MRRLALGALVAIVALAGPAAADAWRWTDEAGEEHFTDDPSGVPPARRHTLKNLADDGGDGDGGTFSSLDEGADAAGADQRTRTLAVEERRRLAEERDAAAAALERLRAARSEARREARKWKAGGRIGAAEKAAAADRKADALDREVQAAEAKVADLEARLARR